MSGPDGSEVEIIISDNDGSNPVDLANHALIQRAEFQVVAGAVPGSCEIHFRDLERDLDFTTGNRIKLKVDDRFLWAGYLLQIGRSNFFPAGDGVEDTKSRLWVIKGVDNNILLDKLVIRQPSNYLQAIPDITTPTFDGEIIRTGLANHFDFPAGFDITTKIDDVFERPTFDAPADAWAWPEQGQKLRFLIENLADFAGAIYYIGPDDAVHYHAIQNTEAPWGFSDRPNGFPILNEGGFENAFEGAYWGFRELDAQEDGSEIYPEAFVWGGSPYAGAGSTVVGHAYDAALAAIHGRWQIAETHFNEKNFKIQDNVTIRANQIVYGNSTGASGGSEPGSVVGEGPRGMRFPQWSYSFTWHTVDVPTLPSGLPRHLYPGDIVPIQLWSFSEDGGTTPFSKFLPLRSMRISFPSGAQNGLAHVRFSGYFDLRNEDPQKLWKFLRDRGRVIANPGIAVATADSESTQHGAFGQFEPLPAANGVQTVFHLELNNGKIVGYIPGTTIVSNAGLTQRRGVDYTESAPENGEITFTTAPSGPLWVICRTLAV